MPSPRWETTLTCLNNGESGRYTPARRRGLPGLRAGGCSLSVGNAGGSR